VKSDETNHVNSTLTARCRHNVTLYS